MGTSFCSQYDHAPSSDAVSVYESLADEIMQRAGVDEQASMQTA